MEMHDKLRKLKEIKDEVNELHPFLNNFLRKLPYVKHVEYTHGNSEYGSDFILISEDPTLFQETYIGIVAKSVEIKQSDIETVVR